ncbi:hypothetical protein EVAR_88094_1 [Eumeta japonica]|uniref:Uncharacterized protein n=1 Tax=Eumeta variegata TaxID=151549 RepID=A0A4C1WFW1_EUMVA|nr:hypothetical protein EVAR_88094_1 [Eumeta japonica]
MRRPAETALTSRPISCICHLYTRVRRVCCNTREHVALACDGFAGFLERPAPLDPALSNRPYGVGAVGVTKGPPSARSHGAPRGLSGDARARFCY